MSSQSSGITGTATDFSGFGDQEEISNLNLSGKDPMSSEWTDEKHCLYLNSMEASFVDQLYSSVDLSSWHRQKKHHSWRRSSKHNESRTLDQFKVHQNGSWQCIKFDNGEPPPQEADETHFLHRNQWIQHFSVGVRQDQTIEGNTICGSQNVSSGGRMMLTCGLTDILQPTAGQAQQDSSVGEEFSDQNFDEDNEEGTGSLHKVKRTKIVESSEVQDQEVPFGRSSCSEFFTKWDD